VAVKIIMSRTAKPEQHKKLTPLLLDLRRLAMNQSGYISGETLVNMDNPEEVLVISAWNSLADWEAWVSKQERQALQAEIDQILGCPTFYKIYLYG
jgi:heme-degrading monooxygenase HmoA